MWLPVRESLQDLGHRLDITVCYHDETLIQRSADYFEGDVFYFDSDAEHERIGLRSALNREFELTDSNLAVTYGVDLLEQSFYRPQVDPASGAVIGYVSPEVLLDQYAAFVQPRWRFGRLQLTGGMRYERFPGDVGDRGYDPTRRASPHRARRPILISRYSTSARSMI